MRRAFVLIAATVLLLTPAASQAQAVGGLVSVGSPSDKHPQNAQNEPALAVDAAHPSILAAG